MMGLWTFKKGEAFLWDDETYTFDHYQVPWMVPWRREKFKLLVQEQSPEGYLLNIHLRSPKFLKNMDVITTTFLSEYQPPEAYQGILIWEIIPYLINRKISLTHLLLIFSFPDGSVRHMFYINGYPKLYRRITSRSKLMMEQEIQNTLKYLNHQGFTEKPSIHKIDFFEDFRHWFSRQESLYAPLFGYSGSSQKPSHYLKIFIPLIILLATFFLPQNKPYVPLQKSCLDIWDIQSSPLPALKKLDLPSSWRVNEYLWQKESQSLIFDMVAREPKNISHWPLWIRRLQQKFPRVYIHEAPFLDRHHPRPLHGIIEIFIGTSGK
jgi:hypothetical protein